MATCEWTRAIVRARAARAERRADDARGGFRAQKVRSRARAGAGKRRARANATVRASENDESGAASNASVRESEPYGENAAKNAAYKASMSDAQLELHRASGRDVTYALKISYDGERYNGFQYQGEDVPTIQRELERAHAQRVGGRGAERGERGLLLVVERQRGEEREQLLELSLAAGREHELVHSLVRVRVRLRV